MGVPLLTSCCCGCSLRTGTIIIGWLNMIPYILLMVLTFTMVPMFYESLSPDEQEKSFTAIVVVVVIIILIVAVGSLLPGLLLIGAYKKNATMLKGWVGFTMFFVFLGFFRTTLRILAGEVDPTTYLSQYIPIILIECYFFLVVYSFYKEIENSPQHLTHSVKLYDV